MVRTSFGAVLFLMVVMYLITPSAWAQADRVLSISGATTVQPVAEQVGMLFTERTGIPVSISGGGTGAGLRNTISGDSDIGMVSRSLRDDERMAVDHLTVGHDALVFIVNSRNPLHRIDRETILRLFSGNETQWRQVTDWDERVELVTKEVGRATLDLFEGYTGLHHPDKQPGSRGSITRNAHEIGANVEALMLVGGLPGAIGYVSMGAAGILVEQGLPVRILELDGVTATVPNVLSGAYPIGRELNFVFTEREGAIGTFLDMVMSSEGQRVVESLSFIPARGR
ncbi:substrate-binding domain-containing protein [Desulfonatronum thioautotrophicum]|uniref:substrate-binding domain-containing protein n=1 Tax=Desulfonatronum thioautotrophicum TaxID=617001 RepID=UPI0005EB72FE|nr:substrate-binding domain-containing protein [Desulfonatronum thioautotrophicum]